MYSTKIDSDKPFKGLNRFSEKIQDCLLKFEQFAAAGEQMKVPATFELVLNFCESVYRSPYSSKGVSAILDLDEEKVLKELDEASDTLVRSATYAGYERAGLPLSVCQSIFVDFSRVVGVATCLHVLTPEAVFADFADLRRHVTEVLDAFYGNIGCAAPYQSGRGNMYVTRYMLACARSAIGLYSNLPAMLRHPAKEGD